MAEVFPKRLKTDKTAEIGVNVVSTIFNDDFGWVFRRTHQEHDFGVDAYIDFVTDDGRITGQSIAAQIKTGETYLSRTGAMHWYKDTKEHLNYFLNLPTPILLIICDPIARVCFWARLEKGKVDFRGESWAHPISKDQKLCKESMAEIRSLFGRIVDHVSEFEDDQRLLKFISDDSFIMYCVPRSDVEPCSTKNLTAFIQRITRNEKLTLTVQGKLYISVHGYESDARELYQIEAVRRWAKKARGEIKQWYLCTSKNPRFSTLVWMAACTCSIKSEIVTEPGDKAGPLKITFKADELLELIKECWFGLNEESEKWGWTEKYNEEVTEKIIHEFFPTISLEMPKP